MKSKLPNILLAFASILAALPAVAHHSFDAEFDVDKPVTIKGVIAKIDWINPHIYFYVDVKGPDGKLANWRVETFPTGFFHRAGLTRDMFNTGDNVTVLLFRAKDGTKAFGWMQEMTLPSGRKIVFGGASGRGNGAPAVPPAAPQY